MSQQRIVNGRRPVKPRMQQQAFSSSPLRILAAVAGTVTANAGTDLNTSLLALESGNLATILEDSDAIKINSILSRRLLENISFQLEELNRKLS